MIKAVVFDFDGTLVNTVDDVSRCFNETLRCFGYAERESPYIRDLIGKSLDDIAEALLPEDRRTADEINRFKDKYREIYGESPKNNTRPYKGIEEVLRALKKKDIKLIINSNKSQALLEDLTAKLFRDIRFDLMIGFVEGVPPKPSPFFMRTIEEKLNVGSDELLYVGDSTVDAETARNAGIPALIVNWGIGDLYRIKEEYPISIVEQAEEIISYIR